MRDTELDVKIAEREAALAECRRTYVPRRSPPLLPQDFICERPEYLEARRHYHALLRRDGML